MNATAFDTIAIALNGKKKTPEEELRESMDALYESLNGEQRLDLTECRYFWVATKGGIRYRVDLYVSVIQEERSGNQWFLKIRGVNIWDELAIKKGWLEIAPEEILAAAKKIEFER